MDFRPLGIPSCDDTLYYILYDLRENTSLSRIHLPTATEGGPVLLLVSPKDCSHIFVELQEMLDNESAQWMATVLARPEYAPTNTSDLLAGELYIMILHQGLLQENPEHLTRGIMGMRKWVTH